MAVKIAKATAVEIANAKAQLKAVTTKLMTKTKQLAIPLSIEIVNATAQLIAVTTKLKTAT